MLKKILIILLIILIILLITFLYIFNILPHKKYTDSDFNITTYKSNVDKDNDGIDDQTDILENAKKYVSTKPKYQSKYYSTGYSSDEYGVCTDVVANAMLNSGYDLMKLVNEDIINNKEEYNIEKEDINIDFRRVQNLKVYFERTATKLTTDINDISEWQGGDIVIFTKHIGIISNARNSKGVPFVIHHANPYQVRYEEDILGYYSTIVGHYRIS